MFIAIDIGNTSTVIGMYRNERLRGHCRWTSTTPWKEHEVISQIHSLMTQVGTTKKQIEGIGISSVVPPLTKRFARMTKKYFHQEPVIISSELNLGITIHYENPKSLGTDRICSAIAGHAHYGGPLIIIDFGTATTYNIIASNGDFLGGVITPGIETAARSLHMRTAKLPSLTSVQLQFPQTLINTTTLGSMQAGILWGALDGMTGIVDRIQLELSKHRWKKAVVIATGGFSPLIAEQTPLIQHVEPMLVLDGIRLIWNRVKNKKAG
jgi:type III pantothenate kinase